MEIYLNGTGVDTETDATTGLEDTEFYILTANGQGAFTTFQYAIFGVASKIVDGQAIGLNGIFETYMDAIGKGVQ